MIGLMTLNNVLGDHTRRHVEKNNTMKLEDSELVPSSVVDYLDDA